MLLYQRSNLNFTKNRGKYKHLYTLYIFICCDVYSLGASIVAETQKVSPIFQHLLSNPLCFLLYEDKDVVPNEWSEVSAAYNYTCSIALYL